MSWLVEEKEQGDTGNIVQINIPLHEKPRLEP